MDPEDLIVTQPNSDTNTDAATPPATDPPPKRPPCPECGKSADDYLDLNEAFSIRLSYARTTCMHCQLTSIRRYMPGWHPATAGHHDGDGDGQAPTSP